MGSRAIPQQAITFIKAHEDCVLRVYDDEQPKKILAPGDKILGTLTAGYGHTGTDLTIGMDVTQEMADSWLSEDCGIAAVRLDARVKPDIITDLTDNQYAALLAFVFNLGANPTWTIWKRLNARQFDQVPLEMMKFVNREDDGKMVKDEGLVSRRAAEVVLWSTQEPGSVASTPPSSVTRASPTPPTTADPTPLRKSKGLIAGAAAAAAGAGPLVDQASKTIAPYAQQSVYVQHALGILATIAALCASAALVFLWLEKRTAQN